MIAGNTFKTHFLRIYVNVILPCVGAFIAFKFSKTMCSRWFKYINLSETGCVHVLLMCVQNCRAVSRSLANGMSQWSLKIALPDFDYNLMVVGI
jgi:hypothetical protein